MSDQETMAAGVRRALAGRRGVSEKKMFGGICFLVDDKMLCGVNDGRYLFRVGAAGEAAALSRPGARVMEQGGRRMAGFVWVDEPACRGPALAELLALAERYVATVPAKAGKKPMAGRRKK